MSKKETDNPWPVFVDIMSSTLLVFVFLVIIQLLVIASLSMKVGVKVSQQILQKKVEDSLELNKSAIDNHEWLSEKSIPDSKHTLFRLIFDNTNSKLTDLQENDLNIWIQSNVEKSSSRRFKVTSVLNQKDLSTSLSYLISYRRAMQVRNQLIVSGFPADNIIIRVVDNNQHSMNELTISYQENKANVQK